MSNKPFELRVVADQPQEYGLSLCRMPARGENVNGSGHDWRQVVNIHGTPMRAVMDQILAAIKLTIHQCAKLGHLILVTLQMDFGNFIRCLQQVVK